MSVAFVCAETGARTTHDELERRTGLLAGALATRGVAAGDRVAVISTARREVFETQYACIRLGAALVPINWRLAEREQNAILEAIRPAAVLSDRDGSQDAIRFGHDYEMMLAAASIRPARIPSGDEIVQILFTSGTTGAAKGAMISWRQLEFNARATADLCDLDETSQTLACLPTFHTGGLNCLATPTLAASGCVWLMERFDAARAAKILSTEDIDATVAVPAMYRELLAVGFSGPRKRECDLLVGGAPLPLSLADAYTNLGHSLRQGFGMTEVGPNCFTGGLTDIGRPTPGTDARVVTEAGDSVPDGEVGELELCGPHVFAGYYERPEATRDSFRGDWFRTGDLALRNPDGTFEIRGRRKEMFISGGENVYPAEVEVALAAHPLIAEVAVIGVADDRWGEVGKAFVVPREPDALSGDDIRSYARENLAGYKVPRYVELASVLPRTATGKVAKSVLQKTPPTKEIAR